MQGYNFMAFLLVQSNFCTIFVLMEQGFFHSVVILLDADYVDKVAFDLTVNFERMLMRRIPQADLAQWLVCVALDGGLLYDGEAEVASDGGRKDGIQVVFLHGEGRAEMKCFTPGRFADVDGQAFRDERLGEFLMSAVRCEHMAGDAFFVECVEALLSSDEVRTVVLIPDMERYGAVLKSLLSREGRKKDVTLLTMQPESGRGFQSEILGYSLMHAMGIRGEELDN